MSMNSLRLLETDITIFKLHVRDGPRVKIVLRKDAESEAFQLALRIREEEAAKMTASSQA